MIRRYYANVKIVDVRQVEFCADDSTPRSELTELASAVAEREWGSFDEFEVVEIRSVATEG